ncbi:hypothetical protein FRC02_011238 [Tulasnella sp. 418]|nr:hypothetical protein FRC02_011238 [Tulasnella sp. 418]
MSIGLSALVALIKIFGESQFVVQIVHYLGWTASGVKAATVAASIQTPVTLIGSEFAILQSYGATHAAVAAPALLGLLGAPALLGPLGAPALLGPLGAIAGVGVVVFATGRWFGWW